MHTKHTKDDTHPSSLFSDPLGDILHEDELADKPDDLTEEPMDSPL